MGRRGIFCTENGVALFTRMQVVEDVTSKTLQQVIGKTVATGAKIECDGYRFNRRKTGDRSSCAWQEPSLHLVLCCVKPISKFQNMTTSAQRQKTPRDPTSGIAGVRGEDLRFRPLSGALGGSRRTAGKKGANMARKAAQNLAAAQEEAEGSEAGSRLAALWLRLRETLLLQLRAEQDAEGQAEVRVFEVAA